MAFSVALGFGILAPAIPVFARTFGVSALEASAVISVFALVRFITAPLAGGLVNRMGERLVLSSGVLIVAVSSAAAGLANNFTHLLVLRGIGGLGSSMFTVSAMALLLRVVSQEQRGRAASAYQGGFLIGGVVGPALGGLVVAWSIRAPFFVYAASLTLAAVIAMVFLAKARLREREEQVSQGQAGRLEQLRDALSDGAYRAALSVSFVTGFVVFGLRSAIIPLFVVEGLDRGASLTGIAFLVGAALQALLLLPAGRMADDRGRRPTMLIGSIALTVGMLVLTAADMAQNAWGTASLLAPAMLLLAMAIQGAASAFLGSAPTAVVGDIVAGRRGGVVVATYQMMSDLGTIIGPLIAGLIVDALDFDWAFVAGSALALLAVIFVWSMPETLGRRMRAVQPRAEEAEE